MHPTQTIAPLAALLLALTAPAPAAAAPVLVAAFDDAAHDADGPGGYAAPGDSTFTEGDFDLRRLAVYADGEDVLFEITLGAPIRAPELAIRSGSTPVPLENGIYLQNVDIYLDTDPASAAGSSACIPGRRVAFTAGRTWKAAVVFTPRPGPARAVTRDALGPIADRVVFVEHPRVQGRTLTARVPAALLGGAPTPAWGYSVHVSGAAWEPSYAVQARLADRHAPDAFTLPVKTTPEAFAFGGGPLGDAHPQVVDVLLPPWLDQHAVLTAYDAKAGTFARVPFLTMGEKAPLPTPAASAVSAPVTAPAPDRAAAGSAGAAAASAGTAVGSSGTTPLPPSLAPSLSSLTPSSVAAAEPAAPSTPAPGVPPQLVTLVVQDVSDELVSANGPSKGLKPMQFGRVVDANGFTVARVMIVRVVEKGVVATAVDGHSLIKKGTQLRFDAAPVAPEAAPKPGPKPSRPTP